MPKLRLYMDSRWVTAFNTPTAHIELLRQITLENKNKHRTKIYRNEVNSVLPKKKENTQPYVNTHTTVSDNFDTP